MIESSLVDKIKVNRGLCLKFTSPSMTGIPDRIILLLRRSFDKERNSVVKNYECFMHGIPENDECKRGRDWLSSAAKCVVLMSKVTPSNKIKCRKIRLILRISLKGIGSLE